MTTLEMGLRLATGAALFVLLSAYGFDAGLLGGVRVRRPSGVTDLPTQSNTIGSTRFRYPVMLTVRR